MFPPTRPKPIGFQLKKLSAAVAMAMLLSQAHAAGWGELTVQSSLGQPLRAEIELVSTSPQDDGALSVKLAGMEVYRQANIEFHPVLMNLRFAVEQRGAKQVVRVTSTQPVNEPFVDMLLELNSGSGRVVREFVFLLDPAVDEPAPAPVAASTREVVPAPARKAAPSTAAEPARAPAARKPAVKPAAAKPRLTLSGVTAVSATDDKPGVIALEDYATMEKQMAEADARVRALEQKVADLEKLLEVTSQLLVEAQKQNAAARADAKPALPAEPPAANPAPPAVPAAAAPAAIAARPAPPAPAPQEDESDYLLPGAGLLAALLGAAGIWTSRRRKAKQAADAGTREDKPAATTGTAEAATTALATGLLLPTGLSHTTHEVDPLAEADVYIAYGRDVQAEDILKEALTTQNDRHPVRVKLLSIYAGRKDLRSFEALARELRDMTKGEGEDWLQAAELGREIDPANPLYAALEEPASTPEAEPAVVLERVEEDAPGAGGELPDFSAAEEIQPVALASLPGGEDEDFDEPAVQEESLPALPLLAEETPGQGPGPIDFTLPDAGAPAIPELPAVALDEPKADGNLLDFDFLKPETAAEAVPELPQAALEEARPEEALLDFDFLKPPSEQIPKGK